jgi:hypothetical protein
MFERVVNGLKAPKPPQDEPADAEMEELAGLLGQKGVGHMLTFQHDATCNRADVLILDRSRFPCKQRSTKSSSRPHIAT